MDRTAHVTPAPETSPYYAMVTSLYSIPLILSVAGCRERANFVYCSNQSGTPLLYRRDLSAATTQLVTPEGIPLTGPFVLHAAGSAFVFAQDTEGDEEYVLHHGDFNGTSRRIPSRSLGRVMHLFWATDDSWIVVGNDQHSAYVRLVMEDGSTRDLFTTDQQLLTAAYDDRRNLVVVSVGRGAATRLAIVDVAAAQVRHWIAEAEQAEATLRLCILPAAIWPMPLALPPAPGSW